MPEVECVWPVGAVLGEGPVWSAADRTVWFVDIKAPAIHRFDPATGDQRTWPAPARVGFVAPTRAGWLIAGLKTGLHRFNPETGNFSLLHVVEPHAPNNRLNDGFVDSEGFLWFGSMDDNEEEPSGALYQLADAGCVTRDPGYVVTNGPAESPDGRVLYHTDTLAGIIYAFDRARGLALEQARVRATAEIRRLSGRAVRRCRRLPVDRRVRRLGPATVFTGGRAAADAATALLRRHQGRLRRR
jgi:sugar lactone lactonase YvrE